MTVDYIHLCDYACVMQNGKPCMVGVFDRLFTHQFPTTHPTMSIAVNLIGRAHEQATIVVEIVPPAGAVVARIEGVIATTEHGVAFLNAHLIGATFERAGEHTVRVSANGQVLATKRLRVELLPAPPAPSH